MPGYLRLTLAIGALFAPVGCDDAPSVCGDFQTNETAVAPKGTVQLTTYANYSVQIHTEEGRFVNTLTSGPDGELEIQDFPDRGTLTIEANENYRYTIVGVRIGDKLRFLTEVGPPVRQGTLDVRLGARFEGADAYDIDNGHFRASSSFEEDTFVALPIFGVDDLESVDLLSYARFAGSTQSPGEKLAYSTQKGLVLSDGQAQTSIDDWRTDFAVVEIDSPATATMGRRGQYFEVEQPEELQDGLRFPVAPDFYDTIYLSLYSDGASTGFPLPFSAESGETVRFRVDADAELLPAFSGLDLNIRDGAVSFALPQNASCARGGEIDALSLSLSASLSPDRQVTWQFVLPPGVRSVSLPRLNNCEEAWPALLFDNVFVEVSAYADDQATWDSLRQRGPLDTGFEFNAFFDLTCRVTEFQRDPKQITGTN